VDEMTISRANMEKQVKYGNKKAKKMMVGGDTGPLGRLIGDKQREKEKAIAGAISQAAQPGSQSMKAQGMAGMTPMKAGGAVKKKRDGCAIKGKTKGTIR
jgi:hypothetical protein